MNALSSLGPRHFLFATTVLLLACSEALAYNPLGIEEYRTPEVKDLSVRDPERNREIPVRVYLVDSNQQRPVVLFSHGLGGSKEAATYLGKHWAARGYMAVFLEHPGSDESVWKDQAIRGRMAAMNEAASGKNFSLRVADVPAVLDQLTQWNLDDQHPLYQKMDLDKVGMSGHSFGAVTTQAVSGQNFGPLGKRFTDTRIKAAIAFSPSTPRVGSAASAFANVSIPWLLMTGTNDRAPIGDQTVESRLQVFPNLNRSIARYQLVLYGAEHSVFTDRELPGEKNKRNPKHQPAIMAISTAFWDAYLRDDRDAVVWLRANAHSVLDSKDQWDVKP